MDFRTTLIVPATLLTLTACQSSAPVGTPGQTAPDTAAESAFHLTVLHTNDHHGHPLAFDHYPMKKVGGLPERMEIVESIRAETKATLLLDAGDWNIGRPESLFFNAEPDIKGYNRIAYDAVTVGNHEFDRSLANLEAQIATMKVPVVIANLTRKNGEPIRGTAPTIIKTVEGKRIGIIGLMCEDPLKGFSPEVLAQLKVTDAVTLAKTAVPELRKNADIVIALTHCGILDTTAEGSMRLAEQVPGIDLIVDGHTHTRMTEPLFVTNSATKRPVPIVQAWQWGLEVGKTDLEISAQNTVKTRYKAIPVNLKNVTKNPDGTKTETPIGTQVAGNAALRAELQPYADKVDQILGEKIGTAAEDFETTTLRSQENPLGNLVADATFAYAKKLGADFVVQNSGSIRAPIKAGPITKKNPYEILPYDNSTVLLTVRGKTVREMFDFVASLPAGVPNFLQIAGAKVTIDRKQKRATSILIAGAPLVDGKNYRLATNSYLVTGGDGFAMLKAAKDPFDTSTFMRDLMIDYIKGQKRPLVPRVDGRIRIVE